MEFKDRVAAVTGSAFAAATRLAGSGLGQRALFFTDAAWTALPHPAGEGSSLTVPYGRAPAGRAWSAVADGQLRRGVR